jgi:hypothetical protein
MHRQQSTSTNGHAVLDRVLRPQRAPWGTLTRVTAGDPKTWRLALDEIGPWRISTAFNPVRFSPAWGQVGESHHFETLVSAKDGGAIGHDETYATEAEALDGHAAVLARIRTQWEAL